MDFVSIEEMHRQALDAIEQEFGYRPDENAGEKWVVYQDRFLVVIHPDRRPRLYRPGANGHYEEIEPIYP